MKKQIYNPRYQQGEAILLNLRSNKVRRSYASYAPVYEGVISPIEYELNDSAAQYDSSGDVVAEDKGGVLSGIGEFLFGDYHHAADRFAEASLADSWRLFHEKRLQAETTNKLNLVSEAESKLSELKRAEDYADSVDKYNNLLQLYSNAIKLNNLEGARNIKSEIDKCIKDIVSFLTDIKFKGKNSDINVDLFFDPSKDEKQGKYIRNEVRRNVLKENLTWDRREPIGTSAALSWVLNLFESGQMAIQKAISPEQARGNFTKKAIKLSLSGDRWTDYLFEGYDEKDGPTTTDLRNKIQPYKNYWERQLENRKIDAIKSSILYKNGNWLFDPQKINPKFRQYSENNDSGLIGGLLPDQLLYSFSELGSSWSDWQNMALMTMSDVAAGYGAKVLTNFAVKRSPYINAVLAIDQYNRLKTAGRFAEASKLEKTVAAAKKLVPQAVVSGVNSIESVGKGAAMLASTYFINRMRQHETNSEVMDAWSNRVLQNAMDKNADMTKVLNNTKEYLTQIGIPTENMTDIDLVQHALAYNIPSGDSTFEQEKESARKGLDKVYNENMSLAAKDYVEALPFLSFLGSVLKSIGNGFVNKLKDRTYANVARGILDKTAERAVSKTFLNSNLSSKLASKHTADYLERALKKAGWVGTMEGIEEGQQHLLQQRYSRGEYDDYNTPTSQFSLPSVFRDFNLGTDAVGAYLGILYGDPDNGTPELRRAMQIGAVAGMLGGGFGLGLASNVLPSEGRDNIRNLTAQLRSDFAINKILGDSYGTAQDTAHMNMFYDAMLKHGVTRLRLQQSLEDLRQFKGENVTDDYISRDVELLNDVWYYTNSDKFNSSMKDRNIKKNSPEYKTEVINAAKRRTLVREQLRFIQEKLREQDGMKNSVLRKVFNSSDGFSEAEDPEVDRLVDQLWKSYDEYKINRKQTRKKLEEALNNVLTNEYSQEWQLKKAEQDLEEFDKSQELGWHDYLDQTIDKMIAYRTLQNAEILTENLTSSKEVVDTISKELGLGIESPKIQPYLDALQLQKDQLYKNLENDDVYNQNELRKLLNAARKKGQPILPLIENIAARIEKKYGRLPFLDEIDSIQQNMLLSRAYYDVMKPISDMYHTGEIDPRLAAKAVSTISWKSLSKEERKLYLDTINDERQKDGKNPLNEKSIIFEYSKRQKDSIKDIKALSEQYAKHLQEHKDEDDSGNVDVDAKDMRKRAAQMLMDFERLKFEDLRRINHREYLREDSTVSVEDAAKNGDEDAKRVLQENLQSYSNDEMSDRDVIGERTDLILTDTPTTVSTDESPQEQTITSTDSGRPVIESPSDESNSIDNASAEGENVIYAPSDESGPQPIDKPSDESGPQPITQTQMTSQERHLRHLLGYDDEEVGLYLAPSDESGELSVDKYDQYDTRDYIEKESDETSIDEQLALIDIDDHGSSRYDDFLQSRDERTILSTDLIYSNFLHLTFKYANYAGDDELPTIITKKIVRDVNGNPIVKNGEIQYEENPLKFRNGAQLRSGGQLAKKLLIPGWFEKADKYFVITADESTVLDIKNPDNLVVIMVIQDGNDAYCTFMTGLEIKINKNGGVLSNGEKEIRNRMKTMYYSSFYTQDDSGITEHVVKDEYGNIDEDEVRLGRLIVMMSQYIAEHPGEDTSKLTQEELWKKAASWYSSSDQKVVNKVDFAVRRFLSGDRPVYSNEKIEEEISKLREVRNSIIDACLTKDKWGNYQLYYDPSQYKYVKPLNPRTSGGKINDVREDGKPVFRKLTDGGFEMSTDIEELTRQIADEEVMIGVGLGERSFAYKSGEKAPIAKLDPESTGNYNEAGYGHSGKIYYIATTVNGDRRAIQLFEKKFKDSIEKVEAEYVEESILPNGKIAEGETPTISEFILRLVTDTISDDVFEGMPVRYIPQFKKQLLKILVNADHSTWVRAKNESKQQHFAQKQFFFDDETGDLIIALPDQNGVYKHTKFNIKDIRSDENVRKIIIAAISNNLHWNTDRTMMVDMMPAEFLECLRQVFKNDDTLTEYKIAGIDDLTFKKSDLFKDDLSYKEVSLAAWMFATGKLLTSVGDTIFDSPFVYADGAVSADPAGNVLKEIEQGAELRDSKELEVNKLERLQGRFNEFNAKRIGNLLYVQDKETRERLTEGKKIRDFALFDIDAKIEDSDELVTNKLKESVKSYTDFLKSEYGLDIEDKNIIYPDESEYSAVKNRQALFTAVLNRKNKVIVSVDSVDTVEQMSQNDGIPVSGVFSIVKQDGTLDVDSAKKWIKDTLGLDNSQFIVTNGVLRAMDGRIVYGVTSVAVDTLNDLVKGVIMLQKNSGRGLHYHEAFHYVNLLLHTKEERDAIYNEYMDLHPETRGYKNKVLEELLADEFMQYCADIDAWNEKQKGRNKISRFIHKIIKDVLDFIKAWGKQDLIKKLYKSIHSGGYKGRLMDQYSVNEFRKAYPSGANGGMYIPGLKVDVKFNSILDARTFFNVAENVAHAFLDFANIKKVSDVSGISASTFDKFLKKLERDNERTDNPYIQDVIDNYDAFIDTINSLLRRYGVVPKNKTAHGKKQIADDDANERRQPTGEIAQLSALYDNYTVSKKDNVAFRAKLFLCQVKESHFVYDENQKQNVLKLTTDPVTGLLKYVSYDDCWLILTKELNGVDSYDELLKTVKRLSKTKAFFAEVYKNLQSISGDIELETQIFNTVNKHLTKVAQAQLLDKKKFAKKSYYSDGTEATEDYTPATSIQKTWDQNKSFEIINDNTLKAKKMLPRDWSKDLFASPLITFSNGEYRINRTYAKQLQDELKELKSVMRMLDSLTPVEKDQISQKAFPMLLSLILKMSIPFDEAVLTEYIQMHIDKQTQGSETTNRFKSKYKNLNGGKKANDQDTISSESFYDAMKLVLSDPAASKTNSANISFYIDTMFNSRSGSIVKIGKKKMMAVGVEGHRSKHNLDELYEGSAGEIEMMAVAYNNIYPSSRELSITGPGGNLIFPVGENNFMSDITRWINKNHDNIIEKLQNTPYARNSNVLEIARILTQSGRLGKSFEFKLNVFVGLEDEKSKKGVDYFGVNSLEDVVAKLMMMNRSIAGGKNKGSDMIILPTMADKKTYYALELVSKTGEDYDTFNMPHDLLISEPSEENEGEFFGHPNLNGVRRFSNATLDRFAAYFEDELNSLEQYYSKENIKAVVNNRQIRKANFHGKVKNGKMDFSGNGGHFRYFYGLEYPVEYGETVGDLNLNQVLEWEYMREQQAGDPLLGDGDWRYRTDFDELDGFEGVRRRLKLIRQYFSNKDVLRHAINKMLFARIDEQMDAFSRPGENQLIKLLSYEDVFNNPGVVETHYANRAIPTLLIDAYVQKFKAVGIDKTKDGSDINASDAYHNSALAENLVLSVVGNFVAQSMISVIEIEKIFSGDPAFYKWKYSRKKERKIIGDRAYDFEVLLEKDTDKIKRLGALLSPGSELRTDFSTEDYQKFPWLKGTKYVNATVRDVKAKSIFLDETRDLFTRQMVADVLRNSKNNADLDYSGVKGENISSKGSEFAKLLTNYGNEVEVEFRGKKFRNAEHAYQTWKSGEFDEVAYNSNAKKPRGSKSANTTQVNGQSTNYWIMEEILTEKLKQHPELVKGIIERGGDAYLFNSTHNVVGDRFWESSGQNKFMLALRKAYNIVNLADNVNLKERNEIRDEQLNQRINKIYTDEAAFKEEFNNLSDAQKNSITKAVAQQIKPYSDITVSDAQVLIRPHLYRKIRMMLGLWSVTPIKITYKDYKGVIHETTYSDDEAYRIIENDPNWMIDPEKAAKVSRLLLFPLKMTYFKNDPRELNPGNNIAYGLYNKMAIFPAFKFLFRSKTGRQIYDRMNRYEDPLDMLTFESAVKVGLNQDIYSPYNSKTESLDNFNEGLNEESGCVLDDSDNESWIKTGEGLTVEVQDLKGLRMQLNTEAHTDEERAIGTQMFKILFGNIYDDEDYVIDKEGRPSRKGKEIRDDIMKCIKSLTALGANHIKKMFYNEDGRTINKDAVSSYLNTVIENNNLSNTVTEILSQGGTIESLMLRTLFEHSVSSLVNSHVIDIETKGGSAVQQSVFGFVSYGAKNVRSEETYDEEGYRELNNGRELSWNEKDGSMEVMLSMNFFKSVVPKSYQRSYDEMRQWLIDHDIIKGWKRAKNPILQRLNLLIDSPEYTSGPELSVTTEAVFDELHIKKFKDIILNKDKIQKRLLALGGKSLIDEVKNLLNANELQWDMEIPTNKYVYTEESKPKPFGVGYRIPTQGLSSTFAFTVADVLPEWVGDTIIVPREFTAQTGSDFDVDKLFLATLSYKNGELELMDGNDFSNASKGAVANRLLKNYIDVVTDIKNRANARASIDVVTDIIQDSTLPAIRGKSDKYAASMYELTPYFQLRRKLEFSIGKNGIGPFALNITNLALTQYAHVSIDFSKLPFKLGALDKVVGEDGIRISDWLSAMVNAHVDVAKDPYVFDLNVNQATYKFVNLLLRAGKGEATFLFLAQPAIKSYASAWNNSQGLYGNNLQYDDKKPERWQLMNSYIQSYANKAKEVIDAIQDEKQRDQYTEKLKNIIEEKDVDWNSIFDKLKAKRALSEQNSVFSLLYQILALKTLDKLDPYAQELSDLVKVSRIDTKKFGNTIALQRNFINEYMRFKYGKRDVTWYNTDGKEIDARERYFQETFLEDKLFTATNLTRDILSTQSIVSSKLFGDIMTTIFSQTFGASEEIKDGNGTPIPVYDKVYDEKVVQEVSNAAENVIRHRLLSFYSKGVNRELFRRADVLEENPKTWNEIEKDNDYTGPIDFTFGGDVEVMLKNLHRLWFGDSSSEDYYELNSIFSNIALIISIIETSDHESRITKYKDLVTESGRIKNELLNYLKPQPANNKFSIPRMLLRKTNRNTFTDEKNRLISAFHDLLTSDIKGIRRMARDLAIYAYYSTYNTNAPNAFFDLVPIEYRKLYDMAIAEGVNQQEGTSIFAVLNDDEIDYSVECSHILDAICRNFYTNDNIVPLYEHVDKYNSKHVGEGPGEIIKNIQNSKIPMFLLTTLQYKPFLKMNVNGDIVLYRKKLRIFAETDSGNQYGKVWNLYLPISKLGVHSGTTHQYEMHASSSDTSMFEDNKIPENWSRNAVGQFVMNFINESQQRIDNKLSKRKQVKTIKYVKVKYELVNRVEIEESVSNDVHLNVDRGFNGYDTVVVENPVNFIKDNSNEVFDLSNDSFKTQLETLKENNLYSAEKDGINIGFVGTPNLKITKEDVTQYVYDEIEKYTASHEGTDEASRKAYGESLLQDEKLNDKVLYNKYVKYAKTIFTWAQINSINIDTMYLEDTPVGRAFNDEYNRVSTRYDFAENTTLVLADKPVSKEVVENSPAVENNTSVEKPSVVDKTSNVDDIQNNAVEGAQSIDKYVDKTDDYLYDEPTPGKPVSVTKEMLERLKLLKALNSVINSESLKGSTESYSDKC